MTYATLITDGVTSLMPWAPSAWLAAKGPGAFLDYTENVSYPLTNPDTGLVDPLQTLSLALAPSGTGEMLPSKLTVDTTGFLVTFWLSGGVPGRTYLVNLVGTTSAGRVFQWDWGVLCRPVLASYPLPLPPSPGFGTPITWFLVPPPPVPSLIFDYPLNWSAWPFGCEVIGPSTPYVPPHVPTPALFFDSAANFGAWPFGCAVLGPSTPYVPGTPVPALIFTAPGNFGAWPFGCEVLGPSSPGTTVSLAGTAAAASGATATLSFPPGQVPGLFFDLAANFGAWPFGCQVI